jgi:hypothetical protein
MTENIATGPPRAIRPSSILCQRNREDPEAGGRARAARSRRAG